MRVFQFGGIKARSGLLARLAARIEERKQTRAYR